MKGLNKRSTLKQKNIWNANMLNLKYFYLQLEARQGQNCPSSEAYSLDDTSKGDGLDFRKYSKQIQQTSFLPNLQSNLRYFLTLVKLLSGKYRQTLLSSDKLYSNTKLNKGRVS